MQKPRAWLIGPYRAIAQTKESDPGSSIPPGHRADVAALPTFLLPSNVTGSAHDRSLGRALVAQWQREGIIQIAMTNTQRQLWKDALAANRAFFARPHVEKAPCVDPLSYAGYIASGEEVTAGIADYSEIFTVTKDLPPEDPRVRARWPCHGPCPWPKGVDQATGLTMKEAITRYTDNLGQQGENLLGLIELGLGVQPGSLRKYTRDGWHHTRVLRFPARNATNSKGKEGRGIGSHTDYGLLVIAGQDDVGGLFIRRPSQQEQFANWKESAAGLREDDDGWVYVPPVDGVHTVILGDMMQYVTRNKLMATPHKVGLNTRERNAIAYFHEPSFQAVLKPFELVGEATDNEPGIHYGTHFTNMFMRNYPDRITTKTLLAENRYGMLQVPELRTMDSHLA
ncbi:hypothetical protein VTJ49DRAFT_213 [Mycothermus thermophilus]|uniref:Fe2OG dioxygenase domain-containing protein n=1 Tax=Humicola insolens TaxID=85995 RepID=A0ABR3VH83_HUMIN